MVKEESNMWGNNRNVIYEDGKKVGEIHHETTFFGNPIDRTYNTEGKKISETRHETTFLGNSIDRTYNPESSKIGEATKGRTWTGTKITHVEGTGKGMIPSTKESTSKKDSSYASSSSYSDYNDSSSSGNGIIWVGICIALAIGYYIFDTKRNEIIADTSRNPVMSQPIRANEVKVKKDKLPLSQHLTNTLERKLPEKTGGIIVSSVVSEEENTYATNTFRRRVYNTSEIHGGQRLMQLSERGKNRERNVFPTNTFHKKVYRPQELHGGQRLMQLSEKKKKR